MRPEDLSHTCVVGLGWGDEGKGKVVDLLAGHFDVVVRFNGGANAGHTVRVGDRRVALHLVPSGLLHPGVEAVIGPGVAVDPEVLVEEVEALGEMVPDVRDRLKVSEAAHVVMPYHKVEDVLSEAHVSAEQRIGTTARGIGPCYADKMRRHAGVRLGDLADMEALASRVREIVQWKRKCFEALYGSAADLDAEEIMSRLAAVRRRLCGLVGSTTAFLRERVAAGARLLFEGAHGALLDVDHGTYPFVTSSNCGAGAAAVGAGVPGHWIRTVVGVIKAYATRVGEGPFPTELVGEEGDRLREQGQEYGTTTGRPRRCGWFDAVATRYAAHVAGATHLALMHLDTLSGFERVGICTAYRGVDVETGEFVAQADVLRRVKPVVEFLPGWREPISEVQDFADLPAAAQRFVERIEACVGVPVLLIGTGPERSQIIWRGGR